MTSIVLIRHGETDWNIEGRYQGQADPPLNNNGIHQAQKLTAELQDIGLDILYTSPLQRTKQTADMINEVLMIPVKYEPRLQEIHQGDWQTRLRSEIENLYPELFLEWETDPWKVTPPGGEHLSEVQRRVYSAIDDILQNHDQKIIGLVTHRIPIALIKVRYQDMDPDIVRSIHLPNAYWEEIPIPTPLNNSKKSR
ncbi:histidine phosphatase family protein [Chloroflexota bacterium]